MPTMVSLASIFRKKLGRETGDFYCGKGIKLSDLHSSNAPIQDIYIPQKMKSMHQAIFGSTGAGKSRLLFAMLRDSIRAGKNVFVLDPKPDPDLLPVIRETAAEVGREQEVIVLDAANPHRSTHKLNPFSHTTTVEQVAATVVRGIPQGGEPFFYEQAYRVALVAIKIDQYMNMAQTGSVPTYNIRRLLEIMSYSWIKNHTQIIQHEAAFSNDSSLKNLVILANALSELSARKFEEVTSSLSNVLVRLGGGSVFEIIDTDDNIMLDRLLNGQGTICYLYTGSLIDPETSSVLSRVFLSMFQSFVGKVYLEQGRLETPFEIYVDEAAEAIYLGLETAIATSRGANVAFTLLTQSVASMDDRVGDTLRQVILDNCAVKLFMVGSDPELTGNFVSQLAGEIPAMDVMIRSGASGGSGTMLKDKRIPVLDPSAVTKLKPRQYYLFMRGNLNYVGTLPHIPGPRS